MAEDRRTDDAALGLVVATARVTLAAARMLARTPGVSPRLAETGREARAQGRKRIDDALTGPLPDAVADFEPALDKWIDQLLESPQFERALERVLSSPKVREAMARQTVGFAGEMTGEVRGRVVRVDERIGRRTAEPGSAGLASRALAFALDIVLAYVLFLVGASLVGLVGSLVGGLRPAWLFAILAGVGWLLVAAAYFVFFWTLRGQSPGMRLLGLRVVGEGGAPLGAGRALVRFAALLIAIIPLFAGLIPALFDSRRRALQDFVAGTVVLYSSDDR